MRELWQSDPFSVSKCLVDTTLAAAAAAAANATSTDHNQRPRRLQKIPATTMTKNTNELHPSGYEHAFDAIYAPSNYQFHPPRPPTQNDYQRDTLRHFCFRVAYRGDCFCGWQTQPNNRQLPSVQKTLEDSVDQLFVRSLNSSEDVSRPPVSNHVAVAGRTDAGVHAMGQICRFRTRRQDLTSRMVQEGFDRVLSEGAFHQWLRVTHVAEVTRAFHPTFTTSWRAYVYLIDVHTTDATSNSGGCVEFWSMEQGLVEKVATLNSLLKELEGRDLDYIGLSYGRIKTKDSICKLYHARACLVQLASTEEDNGKVETSDDHQDPTNIAICIELIGNRFLRRMVRMLVETSMRLVMSDYNPSREHALLATKRDNTSVDNNDRLRKLVLEADRTLAGIAPPDGLIFVEAGLNG